MWTLPPATVIGCLRQSSDVTENCLARRNATESAGKAAGTMTQQSGTVRGDANGEKLNRRKLIAYAITQPYAAGIVALALANHVAGESSPHYAHARA